MAIAAMVNTSGIPTAKAPEMMVFQRVERSVAVIRGIQRGLSQPTTSMISPRRNRQPAWGCSVSATSAFTGVDSFKKQFCHEGTKTRRTYICFDLGALVSLWKKRIASKFLFQSDWTFAVSGGARMKLHEIRDQCR